MVLLWHTSCLPQDLFFSSVFKLEGCCWDFPRPPLIIFIWFHLYLSLWSHGMWRKFFPSSNVETACLLFSKSLCHYNEGLGRRLDTFAQVTILDKVFFFHFVLTHKTLVFLALIPLGPYRRFSVCFWTFSLETCGFLLLALWAWLFIQLSLYLKKN